MDTARQARAAARRHWTITSTDLDGMTPAQPPTAAERVAAVWRITLDAWALSGRELPTYTRDQMPIRRRALGDE